MRKLGVFLNVTLDGYFTGMNGDLSWAHHGNDDPEWKSFVQENASSGGPLLLGRITYEMMASYWPTPTAAKNDPVVAEGMNRLPKLVFSKTLDKASWSNTKLMKGDLGSEVRKMKKEPGEDIAILGSGTIVSQLTQEGLIDEFQLVVHPVVIGAGMTPFEGVKKKLDLRLTKTRTFPNGNVLLCYQPAAT
jgi:dihydrofolate reductase